MLANEINEGEMLWHRWGFFQTYKEKAQEGMAEGDTGIISWQFGGKVTPEGPIYCPSKPSLLPMRCVEESSGLVKMEEISAVTGQPTDLSSCMFTSKIWMH